MKDYLIGRNTPFPAEGHAEVNGKLATVASCFDERWLQLKEGHPLQDLWGRDDELSTVELAWLGDAIQRMNTSNSTWTAREIKKVKTSDPNNRVGALFEILGLSAFQGGGQTVRPMGKNNPGYDGIVDLPDKTEIHLSLKNYGTRSYERDVRKYGRLLEERITKHLRESHQTGIGVRVMAQAYPPSATHWRDIEKELEAAITQALTQNMPVPVKEFWQVRAFSLPDNFKPWSSKYLSYQFMLIVPHHPNELKNIIDKLDEACANFRAHAKKSSPSTPRVVLIRVPASASTELCRDWVTDYFLQRNELLDGIILYQPTVIRDQRAGTTSLAHYVITIENPKRTWANGNPLRKVQPNVFVGVPIRKPSMLMITDGDTQFPLRGMYVYQHGDLYTLHKVAPKAGATGHLRNLASGIRLHAVFDMGDGEFTLQGKFPPADELLLLP
jgi:hypothetical protein